MIQYFSRSSKKIEIEKVYGDGMVQFAYQNSLGVLLSKYILSKKWLSQMMGWYQNTFASAKGIPEFIKKYDINMNDYEAKSYSSFNDFFIRKFKPSIRTFNASPEIFCAGAEARYLAIDSITEDTVFPVKGIQIKLSELFGSETISKDFLGGTLIIARLCPVDYHRFHFPVSGNLTKCGSIHGDLHSVNPAALSALPKILFKNERHIAIFENQDFGKVAMIEVGAMGVGLIVQTAYRQNQIFDTELVYKFEKGQEKGYFLFGASTVIWVVQKDRLQLDADLKQNSVQGLETWIPLGDRLGERKQGAANTSTTRD